MTLIVAPGPHRAERFCNIVGLTRGAVRLVASGRGWQTEDLEAAMEGVFVLAEPRLGQAIAEQLVAAGVDPTRVITSARPLELLEALRAAGAQPDDPARAVEQLIAEDFLERAYYAYPLMLAVAQARRMGLRRLVAVEFGVWEGAGLLNMASLCGLLGRTHGIDFQVVGFDTGGGMPAPMGWPDHPEIWHAGDLKLPDSAALRRRLPANAELILGDVAETVPEFAARLTPEAPLAFVALDLDFYSSSVAALGLFDQPDQSIYLPTVPIYVDDSYVGITQHELSGEALAIHMHNLPNLRRLEAGDFAAVRSLILRKPVRPRAAGRAWHHCIHFAHMCQHPVRAHAGGVKFAGLHHTAF